MRRGSQQERGIGQRESERVAGVMIRDRCEEEDGCKGGRRKELEPEVTELLMKLPALLL